MCKDFQRFSQAFLKIFKDSPLRIVKDSRKDFSGFSNILLGISRIFRDAPLRIIRDSPLRISEDFQGLS